MSTNLLVRDGKPGTVQRVTSDHPDTTGDVPDDRTEPEIPTSDTGREMPGDLPGTFQEDAGTGTGPQVGETGTAGDADRADPPEPWPVPGSGSSWTPETETPVATGVPGTWLRAAAAALVAVLLAATALTAFVAGQDSYATPPGTVTVVDGADEDAGFAHAVYETSADAVVRISQVGGGVGSGFFYAPGKIVTNAHVVSGSPAADADFAAGADVIVEVTLHDGRIREAVVTAIDVRLDLAILTLDPVDGVPVLAFADGIGDAGSPLAVLGHPFGEGLMVTTGVLSGVSNNSRFAESDVQSLMLQIDAAVNPGNSGGPVLDASGAVTGMVTLRPDEADGRTVAGLALAIPAPVVAAAIAQLEDDGTVAYPLLGVLLRDTTTDDDVTDAAAVIDVVADSAAAKAGIRVGDTVVGFDDEPVTSARDVVEALIGTQPGQVVALDVVSADGQSRTARVTLGSR